MDTENRMRAEQEHGTEAGFTLLEVMIALSLLLVGMTGVALAQIQALRSGANSATRSKALYLAEEQLERFQAMPTNALMFTNNAMTQDPANPIDPNPNDDRDPTQFYRCWQITPNAPPTGVTLITVEVRVNQNNCNAAAPDLRDATTVRLTGVK